MGWKESWRRFLLKLEPWPSQDPTHTAEQGARLVELQKTWQGSSACCSSAEPKATSSQVQCLQKLSLLQKEVICKKIESADCKATKIFLRAGKPTLRYFAVKHSQLVAVF